MSVRPPKALAPKGALQQDPLTAALEHEVLSEKAATYGRLVQQLEKALQALHAYEFAHGESTQVISPLTANTDPKDPGLREGGLTGRRAFALASQHSETEHSARNEDAEYQALLDAAGQALWYVMIQRDLCGFRNHTLFYKEMNVPAAVRLRMGLARSR